MGGTLLCPLLSLSSHPLHSMVSDGTVAIFISLVMFILPSKIPGLTQDPSKHLPWGREGDPAAPVCRYIALNHIWQEPAKFLLGDLPKTQGLRDRVGILQRWETSPTCLKL